MDSAGLFVVRANHSFDFHPHERSPIPHVYRIVLMVPLTIIITFTVGGNLLTIIVMRLDKRLRSQPVSSMYIASLAGADLLVGSVVMTFMLLYTITFNGRWVFGSMMCTIWTCVDYLSCTASLTNVFLIAVDRYRSVSQPLKAIRRRTRRRASLFLATAWIVPAFFWVSVICLMRAKTDDFIAARHARNPVERNGSQSPERNISEYFYIDEELDISIVCDTRWDPPELAIIAVVIMLYIPLVAILVLFALIMCVLRRNMIAMTERIRRTQSLGNDSSGDDSSATYRQRDDAENLVADKYRKAPATTCSVSSAAAAAAAVVSGGGSAIISSSSAPVSSAAHTVDSSVKQMTRSSPTLVSCFRTDRNRDGPPEVRGGSNVTLLQRARMESSVPPAASIRFCSRNSETRVYAPRDHSEGSFGNGDSKDGSSSCSENLSREPLHWARNLHYSSVEMPRYQRYASQLRAQRQDSLQEVRLRQQIKAARILGAITGFLLLCWIPFTVMLAIKAFCSDCLSQRTFDIAIWINYINSGINPIIYCLCNSQYRQALLKMARRAKCTRCVNCLSSSSG